MRSENPAAGMRWFPDQIELLHLHSFHPEWIHNISGHCQNRRFDKMLSRRPGRSTHLK